MPYAIGAVILVLILILLWVNVSWARRQESHASNSKRNSKQKSKSRSNSKQDKPEKPSKREKPSEASEASEASKPDQGAKAKADNFATRRREKRRGRKEPDGLVRGQLAPEDSRTKQDSPQDSRPESPDTEEKMEIRNPNRNRDQTEELWRELSNTSSYRMTMSEPTDLPTKDNDTIHSSSESADQHRTADPQGSADSRQALDVQIPGDTQKPVEPDADPDDNQSVELLERRSGRSAVVFNKPSYYLNDVSVPDFEQARWKRSFDFLVNHENVLGWIAFDGDTVGAADQKYDGEFLDALRGYRQSTNKLQQHVGLSHIIETSIVGEEGKVWFLTVVEDTWFALFVDRSVNGSELTRRLLASLQTNNE